MPRRYTKLFLWSRERYRFDCFVAAVKNRVRGLRCPVPAPAEALEVFLVLDKYRDLPGDLMETLPFGDAERRALLALMKYPAFGSAALACLSLEPPIAPRSAFVRHHLMNDSGIDVSGGRGIAAVGAMNKEITEALTPLYRAATGRSDAEVTADCVMKVRQRLERKYGMSVSEYVDLYFRLTASIDRTQPRSAEAKARVAARAARRARAGRPPINEALAMRERLRKALVKSYYRSYPRSSPQSDGG